MASGGYEKSRVHVKLLSYLKKKLTDAEHRLVCPETCEPCMLAKEEKSPVGQKYVFLSSNAVYQVDYKLKSDPKVLCHLEDIVSVKQTSSLPVFLSKEDGEKTVHVRIIHLRKEAPMEGKSLIRSWSPSFLKKMTKHNPINLKSSNESVSSLEEGELFSYSSAVDNPDNSDGLARQHKSLSTRQNASGFHGHQPVPGQQDQTHTSSHSPGVQMKSRSPLAPSNKPHPPTSSTNDSDRYPSTSSPLLTPSPPRGLKLDSVDHAQRDYTSHRASLSPLCQAHVSGEFGSKKIALSPAAFTRKGLQLSPSPVLPKSLQLTKSNRSLSSLQSSLQSSSLPHLSDAGGQKKSQSMDFDRFLNRSLPSSPSPTPKYGNSLSVASSLNGSSWSLDSRLAGSEGFEATDLYILNVKSNFHHYLVSAWEERLVALTCQHMQARVLPSSQVKSLDSLRMQYQGLQQELMMSVGLEETAELLNELLTACQRFPELKLFFWEDTTVLDFCLRLLETHLPATPPTTDCKITIHRADQLKLCVLSIDVLYQMMCDIRCSEHRTNQLKRSRGQWLKGLVHVVLKPLALPKEKRPVSASQRDEIERLICEVVETITCLLSQAAKTLHQRRVSVDKTSLNLAWYSSLIAAHDCVGQFFERVVLRCSHLTKAKELSPEEVVVVYHAIHLLLVACGNSKKLMKLFQENFTEEIRYFLRISIFTRIIPDNILLKQKIIEELQELKSMVLTLQ